MFDVTDDEMKLKMTRENGLHEDHALMILAFVDTWQAPFSLVLE